MPEVQDTDALEALMREREAEQDHLRWAIEVLEAVAPPRTVDEGHYANRALSYLYAIRDRRDAFVGASYRHPTDADLNRSGTFRISIEEQMGGWDAITLAAQMETVVYKVLHRDCHVRLVARIGD